MGRLGSLILEGEEGTVVQQCQMEHSTPGQLMDLKKMVCKKESSLADTFLDMPFAGVLQLKLS